MLEAALVIRLVSVIILLLFRQIPAAASQSELPEKIYLPIMLRQDHSPTEAEPNNTRAQANGPLAFGVKYYGMQDNSLDRYDIFYFNATGSGNIRVNLNNPPHNNLQLQLHTSTTVLPLRYDYQAPYEITYTIPTAGKYLIVIYYPEGPPSSQVYELIVSVP